MKIMSCILTSFYEVLELILLDTVVKLWMDEVHRRRPDRFQQGSVSLHKAYIVQEWISESFYAHLAPNLCAPNSPSLNSMGCCSWSTRERRTNQHLHNTIISLIAATMQLTLEMNREHLVQGCQWFQPCIKAVRQLKAGSENNLITKPFYMCKDCYWNFKCNWFLLD